jgi:hypothetical protein
MAYNPRASDFKGQLNVIKDCWLLIPNEEFGSMKIEFQALPTVTDAKGAKYDPTPVIGRASPLLVYANSDLRTISLDLPFFVTQTENFTESLSGESSTVGTVKYNLQALRAIMSATYPRKGKNGVTYRPPPVCVFKYGEFLCTKKGGMCVIIDKYSVKNDPTVPSDPETLCPYKFTVNVSLIKTTTSDDLPNQDSIWEEGV